MESGSGRPSAGPVSPAVALCLLLGWTALYPALSPAAGPLRAQERPLSPGDWVRIRGSAPGADWIEGEVTSLEGGMLGLRSSTGRPTRWPTTGIAEIEVSRGARRRVLEGALLGLGAGLGLRALIRDPSGEGDAAVGSDLLSAKSRDVAVVTGAALGVLTGWHWRAHRWEALPDSWRLDVSVPAPGRLAVGMRWRR